MSEKEEVMYKRLADYLVSTGYDFEFDSDGFWFEEYVDDHKWKDVFELMEEYSQHQIKLLLEDLLKEEKEVINSPIRFNGVDVVKVKAVFEKYGVKYETGF
jgi:hypothetical protein